MSTPVGVPKLGVTMTEATLVEWLVEDGARVEIGDPLYVLETDKTETEIDATVAGVIRITGEVGETYQVGDLIGEIGSP